jgi:hypothetical protein
MKALFQLIVAGGLLAGMAQQLSQPPKPSQEHRKLQLWTGEWTYEGEN